MRINELFQEKLHVINLGLESFYQAQIAQNVDAIHVDWTPPAGGDPRLIEILDKLKG